MTRPIWTSWADGMRNTLLSQHISFLRDFFRSHNFPSSNHKHFPLLNRAQRHCHIILLMNFYYILHKLFLTFLASLCFVSTYNYFIEFLSKSQ